MFECETHSDPRRGDVPANIVFHFSGTPPRALLDALLNVARSRRHELGQVTLRLSTDDVVLTFDGDPTALQVRKAAEEMCRGRIIPIWSEGHLHGVSVVVVPGPPMHTLN